VIGYFSAAVEWAHMIGRPEAWRDWWQDPKSRHFYFMGKDNIVFHTTIWPAILLGYGNGGTIAGGRGGPPQPPHTVVSSEFQTMRSSSRPWNPDSSRSARISRRRDSARPFRSCFTSPRSSISTSPRTSPGSSSRPIEKEPELFCTWRSARWML